jgi:hypothetical protein
MWRCVDLTITDVSEERIPSIFRVEKSANEEPAWAGGLKVCDYVFSLYLEEVSCLVSGGRETEVIFVICKFITSESVTFKPDDWRRYHQTQCSHCGVGLYPIFSTALLGSVEKPMLGEEWGGETWNPAWPRLLLIGNKAFRRHVVSHVALERWSVEETCSNCRILLKETKIHPLI